MWRGIVFLLEQRGHTCSIAHCWAVIGPNNLYGAVDSANFSFRIPVIRFESATARLQSICEGVACGDENYWCGRHCWGGSGRCSWYSCGDCIGERDCIESLSTGNWNDSVSADWQGNAGAFRNDGACLYFCHDISRHSVNNNESQRLMWCFLWCTG